MGTAAEAALRAKPQEGPSPPCCACPLLPGFDTTFTQREGRHPAAGNVAANGEKAPNAIKRALIHLACSSCAQGVLCSAVSSTRLIAGLCPAPHTSAPVSPSLPFSLSAVNLCWELGDPGEVGLQHREQNQCSQRRSKHCEYCCELSQVLTSICSVPRGQSPAPPGSGHQRKERRHLARDKSRVNAALLHENASPRCALLTAGARWGLKPLEPTTVWGFENCPSSQHPRVPCHRLLCAQHKQGLVAADCLYADSPEEAIHYFTMKYIESIVIRTETFLARELSACRQRRACFPADRGPGR